MRGGAEVARGRSDVVGRIQCGPDAASARHPLTAERRRLRFVAPCSACHPAPYYTDNLMHNLRTERFFKPRTINGHMATGDGPIKTFPLRGIKDSPPYLHDARLMTLDDTVEFFNLILELKLTGPEKQDLVAFLRTL